jgi:hypothetical protein
MDSFFTQGILHTILFKMVLIHQEMMPGGEFIKSKQKNWASSWPMLDFLHAPVVAGYVEEDWVRIICNGCSEDDME